jgi:hypothetical protein
MVDQAFGQRPADCAAMASSHRALMAAKVNDTVHPS